MEKVHLDGGTTMMTTSTMGKGNTLTFVAVECGESDKIQEKENIKNVSDGLSWILLTWFASCIFPVLQNHAPCVSEKNSRFLFLLLFCVLVCVFFLCFVQSFVAVYRTHQKFTAKILVPFVGRWVCVCVWVCAIERERACMSSCSCSDDFSVGFSVEFSVYIFHTLPMYCEYTKLHIAYKWRSERCLWTSNQLEHRWKPEHIHTHIQ